MTSEQDPDNVTHLDSRRVTRVNGVKLNLSAMSDLELMVLESQVSDQFVQAHQELEIVRRALAERRPQDEDASTNPLPPQPKAADDPGHQFDMEL